ncbi:MAG: hypothetical protein R3E12_11775 [Candidatus Eisenbacteria bacterium]|uniref:Uncharacterized protein n=1 Tax=Eiseniibacteriota bacterium TaxID=2212470 RepID=A0A956RRA4_UNCEI|nr:hypothetical protein [Candidatus Eisenbacteria bacterium]
MSPSFLGSRRALGGAAGLLALASLLISAQTKDVLEGEAVPPGPGPVHLAPTLCFSLESDCPGGAAAPSDTGSESATDSDDTSAGRTRSLGLPADFRRVVVAREPRTAKLVGPGGEILFEYPLSRSFLGVGNVLADPTFYTQQIRVRDGLGEVFRAYVASSEVDCLGPAEVYAIHRDGPEVVLETSTGFVLSDREGGRIPLLDGLLYAQFAAGTLWALGSAEPKPPWALRSRANSNLLLCRYALDGRPIASTDLGTREWPLFPTLSSGGALCTVIRDSLGSSLVYADEDDVAIRRLPVRRGPQCLDESQIVLAADALFVIYETSTLEEVRRFEVPWRDLGMEDGGYIDSAALVSPDLLAAVVVPGPTPHDADHPAIPEAVLLTTSGSAEAILLDWPGYHADSPKGRGAVRPTCSSPGPGLVCVDVPEVGFAVYDARASMGDGSR